MRSGLYLLIAFSIYVIGCSPTHEDLLQEYELQLLPDSLGSEIDIGFNHPDHVVAWRILADTVTLSGFNWQYIKDMQILPNASEDSFITVRFREWDFWLGDFESWSVPIRFPLIDIKLDGRKVYYADVGTVFSGENTWANMEVALSYWNSGFSCDDCFFAQLTTWPNNGLIDSLKFDFGQVGNYYTYYWPEPWWIDTGQVYYYQGSVNP